MKLTLPALILLFASATFAQSLTVTPESAALCPCSTQPLQIALSNTANTQSTYLLSTSGDAGAWATITENTLSLNAGETRTTFAYLTVPCNAQPADQNLEVKANYGAQSASQRISVHVLDCYKLAAEPPEQNLSGCRGDLLPGNVSIINGGKYKEVVLIDTGTLAASADPFALTIPAQEKKSIATLLNTTAISRNQYQLILSANSSRSPAGTRARLNYNIITCYNTSVSAPESMDVCSGEPEELQAEAKNSGTYNETANLLAYGESGQLLYNRTLLLEPNSGVLENLTMIFLNTPKEAISIRLQAARTQEEARTEVRILDCSAFSAMLIPNFEKLCPCQSGTSTLRIANLGKRRQNFSITSTGIANATLELQLGPYEKKDVEVRITAQCEASPANKLEVTVTNGKYTQKLAGEAAIPNFSACYNASVEIRPAAMSLPREKGEVLNISMLNAGLTDETFEVEPFGGNWLFMNPTAVSIPPGGNRTLYLYANPPSTIKPDNYTIGVVARSKRQLIGGYAKIQVSGEVYSPPTKEPAAEPILGILPQTPASNQTNASPAPTGYATLGKKGIARTLAIIGVLITILLIFLISWKAKKEEESTEAPTSAPESQEESKPAQTPGYIGDAKLAHASEPKEEVQPAESAQKASTAAPEGDAQKEPQPSEEDQKTFFSHFTILARKIAKKEPGTEEKKQDKGDA